MAVDKTRADVFMQKKTECFFAIDAFEGSEDDQFPAGTDESYLVANLPPDSTITDAYVFVKTVSDAATSATASLGTTEGGTEILSAANLTTLGDQGTFTGKSDTGTGVELYLNLAYVGAATNVGNYVVVVEYLEYNKRSGEYTVISRK